MLRRSFPVPKSDHPNTTDAARCREDVRQPLTPPVAAVAPRSVRGRNHGARAGLAVVISASVALGLAAPVGAAQDSAFASFSTSQIRPITFPVDPSGLDLGENGRPMVYWSDTFGAARSGGRSHVGVDMMGPKMTPLVAAVDGTITWMRSNGNNMLVITDDDGWEYWYIHLNNDTPGTDDGANNYDEAFGPGIEAGATVVAGQLIGYMGDSGNAEGSGSHLHFEIENPDGQNVNPTYSVDDALTRLTETTVAPELVAPFADFDALVEQVYDALVGRQATAGEREALAQKVINEGLFEALVGFVDSETRIASIDRLYFAVFNRVPDLEGYRYWVEQGAADWTLADISEYFATSPEFDTRFGSENFAEMLDQMYLGMFDRAPDEEGKAYWLERLEDPDDPVNPGTVVSYFSEGEEAKIIAGSRNELVALMVLFLDRMPTQQELDLWKQARRAGDFRTAAMALFAQNNEEEVAGPILDGVDEPVEADPEEVQALD